MRVFRAEWLSKLPAVFGDNSAGDLGLATREIPTHCQRHSSAGRWIPDQLPCRLELSVVEERHCDGLKHGRADSPDVAIQG